MDGGFDYSLLRNGTQRAADLSDSFSLAIRPNTMPSTPKLHKMSVAVDPKPFSLSKTRHLPQDDPRIANKRNIRLPFPQSERSLAHTLQTQMFPFKREHLETRLAFTETPSHNSTNLIKQKRPHQDSENRVITPSNDGYSSRSPGGQSRASHISIVKASSKGPSLTFSDISPPISQPNSYPPSHHALLDSLIDRNRPDSVMNIKQEGNDFPSMIAGVVSEVTNARAELAEQCRWNDNLQTRLDKMTSEKSDISKRLELTKTVAKRGLEESNKHYLELQNAFKALKAEHDALLPFVREVRTTLIDLAETKRVAGETIQAIEPLLDEDGQYIKGMETKTIIDELKNECSNSGQVIDMLRDKLHTLGGELVNAKERVAELENTQIKEGNVLHRSANVLLASSQKFSELVDIVAVRERESIDTLSKAAELDGSLAVANERILDMERNLAESKEALERGELVARENIALNSRLENASLQIASLENLQHQTATELRVLTATTRKQETELVTLRAVIASNDKNRTQLKILLQKANLQAQERYRSIQTLQEEIRLTGTRESAALVKSKQAEDSIMALEKSIEQSKKEIAFMEDKLHQANTRCSVLQERFDDQSITLRLAKDHSCDLQDRLLTAETSYATKIEANSGKLNLEIAVLKQQLSTVQANLEDARAESARQYNAFVGASVDFEKKLAQQDIKNEKLSQAEVLKAKHLERELTEERKKNESMERIISVIRSELEAAKKYSAALQKPVRDDVNELKALQMQVKTLEDVNEELVSHAKTMQIRYAEGKLNEDEKAFVNSLMQMSKSLHEEEIIAKGNELRRREHTITTLQAKIGVLESTLARNLQVKGKESGTANQSMIDLQTWMTSPLSLQKSDRGNTETMEQAVTAQSVSIINPGIPLISPHRTAGPTTKSTKAAKQLTRDKALPPHTDPNAQQSKTFSKLAIEGSEESEEDTPLSESLAGTSKIKRDRPSSPTEIDKNDESSRPKRRLKLAPPQKRGSGPRSKVPDDPSIKKLAEVPVTAKSRKRK